MATDDQFVHPVPIPVTPLVHNLICTANNLAHCVFLTLHIVRMLTNSNQVQAHPVIYTA